jgi:hypothetical protein
MCQADRRWRDSLHILRRLIFFLFFFVEISSIEWAKLSDASISIDESKAVGKRMPILLFDIFVYLPFINQIREKDGP